ncbi:MAG: Flp pilus assembly protein CpaB [Candidatus Omnitrophica bacterium]|nr:Flp pilus assembly protein CpaB [Candidatus Omnitrophota bacterium]MDD5351571.1 Flp pilus assembly protein CpaB [Candidatus Omnitrophota bacterium]MDD5551006.1 Flp pilus assembly protein CpaB [Candidatus Omnitrophota bacterium]
MNKRLLSIIIAVVMSLLAVVMINTYLNREKQKYKIQLQETTIVVAGQDIPKGATIQPNMLRQVKFPVQYMQPDVLQNPNAAFGKIAVTDIHKDGQVLSTMLTTIRKTEDSLAVRLPTGKRAFTIKIEPLMAVAGEVKAGDYIDIIGGFPYTQNVDGKAVTENVSVTLFQKILVMGVNRDSSGSLVFILALTPQESAILSYAMTQGALRFILRQPLDTAIESVPPIEANALWQYIISNLGQQLMQQPQQEKKKEEPQVVEQPVAPPPPPAPTLEIYKGAKKEQIELKK